MTKKILKFIARLMAAATILSTLAVVSLVSATTATSMKDTLGRLKINETGVSHSLSITSTTAAKTKELTLDYNTAGFASVNVDSAVCDWGGNDCTVAQASNVITITCTEDPGPCTGVLTLTTWTATNPSSAGSKKISIGGDAGNTGEFAIAIVTDDQVSVSATVDPSITFNVGAEASGTACAGTYAGNGGTVALGTLSTSAITSSDVSSVYHICSRVSTNATGGAAVSVKSTNASLKSTSNGSDTIPSASAAMAVGAANYGLCGGSESADSGKDTTTPAGAAPTRVSPFDQTCAQATAGGTVGALTTGAQNVWTLSTPSSNAFMRMYIKAAISATTRAHNDYADTLTFVTTGTF